MPAAQTPPRVVVVGGGIAGLAAAHRLSALGARVCLFESAPELGGKLALGELAGIRVDTGAESLLNRRPEAVDLARAVGLDPAVCYPDSTSAAIWSRGSMHRLPPTVLGVPSDLAALARSRVLSRAGLARAVLDRLLPGAGIDDDPAADISVGAFVTRRLGTEVRDRLVEPLLGGVYAGHAAELSLAAAAPHVFELARQGGSLVAAAERSRKQAAAGAAVPVFAGLVGGVGQLPSVVAGVLAGAGVALRTGVTVRELVALDPSGAGPRWQLVVGRADRPELVEADAVVLAVPAPSCARLLEPVLPRAAIELRRIDYASVGLVSLALPAGGLTASPTGSGFLVPPVDGHAVKAVTWSTAKWGWQRELVTREHGSDTTLVRVSFGRHREVNVLQREDAELIELAVAELVEAVGLRGRLLDARVDRWGGALPQYAVGHRGRVARIRTAVQQTPGLEVCGAAYDGVGVAACIADGWQAAERTARRLPPRQRTDRGDAGTLSP